MQLKCGIYGGLHGICCDNDRDIRIDLKVIYILLTDGREIPTLDQTMVFKVSPPEDEKPWNYFNLEPFFRVSVKDAMAETL